MYLFINDKVEIEGKIIECITFVFIILLATQCCCVV